MDEKIKQEFPGNSNTKKVEKKKVQQVTKGQVVKKKKGVGTKFAETFLGDDIESISTYIIHDVVIPATKNMISDTVSNGIEMLLFGSVRGSKTSRNRGVSHVNYQSISKPRNVHPQSVRPVRDISYTNRARHNFDDIILESRGEAEQVLSALVDLIEDYGLASVADLYHLVGITSNFTDNNYGWDNLSQATVSRVRNGYLIQLPKTIIIE